MKNMKYLSLLATLGLLVGCTSDLATEEAPQPPSVPEQKISHVVPVEQALEDLQGLLEAIDAPAEDGAATRSGGVRRVKSVTTVSPEALNPGSTRSEATADVEDLLYIVNFENAAGYAILGADDRLEPVYAVVDEGSLTTEDFRYAVTVTDEQAQADGKFAAGYAILGADDRLEPVYAVVDEGSLTTEDFRYAVTVTDEQAQADGKFVFPLQLVAQAALGGIGTGGTGGGGNGIGGGPITDIGHLGPTWLGTTYSDWETQELQPTLVSTAWNQDAPYNYLCPPTQEGNCVAGCVPIAVAQILVHNAVEYNKKFYQMGRKPIKKIYGLRSKML